ncbi:hypothetical protein Rhopal_006157-T1 [Rhodotorula paludigena]|uniref:Chromatin modification-related protein EAF6 n=1 Tax=Rhodotorula paludigena TaxID=86838 RepID=A0AAV5GVN7_9BASI|nr:hypothetical protein Rhopal_006157-T1 [Rhodotorula paludigena]
MAEAQRAQQQQGTPGTQPAPSSAAQQGEQAPPPPQQQHPLDGLSPTDLRNKLDAARKDLRGHLERKRRIDRDLATLEQSIYAFEGSYLSDALFPASSNTTSSATSQFGNIIRGYDSYLKAPSASGGDRKRGGRVGEGALDKERMFSASSATYQRSVELRQAEAAASVEPESDDDSSRNRKRNRH